MTMKYQVLAAAAGIVGLALLSSAAAPAAADPESGETAPTDTADADAPAAIDGAAIFAQRCGTCHTTEPGQPSYAGPNLAGVVGRAAASTQFRYSPAMRNSGLNWTSENLDAFIASPKAKVPGTSMFISLADDAQRQAVVTYLATLAGEPVPQP